MVIYFLAPSEYLIELPINELRLEIDPFFSGLLKSCGFLEQELFFEKLTKILEDFFNKGMNRGKKDPKTVPLDGEFGLYFEVEKSNGSKPFISLSLVSTKENSVLGYVEIYFTEEEFKKFQEAAKNTNGHSTINLLKPLGL